MLIIVRVMNEDGNRGGGGGLRRRGPSEDSVGDACN